jgi:hypothetical protein
LFLYNVVRIGLKVYLQTSFGNQVIDLGGNVQANPPFTGLGVLISEGDSVGYHSVAASSRTDSLGQQYFLATLTKISSTGDSEWTSSYEFKDEAGRNGYSVVTNPLLPDGLDGVFFVWSFVDTNNVGRTRAQRINRYGAQWPNGGIDVQEATAPFAFAGRGQLGIYFRSGHAQSFDSSGDARWPTPFSILADPSNAYNLSVGSDHKGGGIVCYWRLSGGIWVKHTGRYGSLGVITDIAETISQLGDFHLFQNYPNPFNASTIISYALPSASYINLSIYNTLGQLVETLVDEIRPPGKYSIVLNAANMASGVYFCRLRTHNFSECNKLILSK